MPELPEVETVRRTLEPLVLGARIDKVWTSGKPLRLNRPVDAPGLKRVAQGATITALRRRAKYLLVDTEKGTTLVHLGMSGRVRVQPADEPRAAHTHVAWRLADGRELRFVDPRRFGLVMPVPRGGEAAMAELAELGVEPLGPEFTPEKLHELARASKRALKLMLLDQTAIVGLGNIYVAEALFDARLHPHRIAKKLTAAQAKVLHAAIVDVLSRAIANRGTTLRDYVDSNGEVGFNQLVLSVYGRGGQACPSCGKPIRAVVTQGRGTFYCPNCQIR
jgi:formamidopyrimidine-DNA glycosylase